jgi:chromosomal replication initiator protein
VIDHLSEIALPGRMFSPPHARTDSSARRPVSIGFVVGAENRLVGAAVNRLMQQASSEFDEFAARTPPAKLLALFGPHGTGKTHLALGLVHYWNEHRGDNAAAYLTAADFYRQYIDAIKQNAVADFRRAVRGYELLAIDDLHQLPAKDHVSQELRFTIDAYEEAGGTLIVAARRAANTLPNISVDVRSRLASGLAIQLARPGNAARIWIIRRASETLEMPITDQTASQLASHIGGTANDLFGALFECCTAAKVQSYGAESDHELKLTTRYMRQPPLREIIAAVARYYGVPQTQLKSQSRRQSIVAARATAIYLARELAGASYQQIGRALGGRDHTTIIHNYRKIERTRAHDPALQETLDELRRVICNH